MAKDRGRRARLVVKPCEYRAKARFAPGQLDELEARLDRDIKKFNEEYFREVQHPATPGESRV